jgi:integrase
LPCGLEAAIAGSHLADFIASLRAMRRTDKHVWELASQIRNTCVTVGFLATRDLNEGSLNHYLARLLDSGKSFRSRNYLLAAFKSFAKFLVDCDELRQNPFARIKKLNEDADPKRRRRRPLTPDEFERLIAAAERGPQIEGMSGIDRAMLYILAAWTGYRRSELSRLTLADFRLDDEMPAVVLPSHHSKARRDDEPIPLHPEVVRRFKTWLQGRSNPDAALFPVANRKTADMMRRDLQAAGIASCDSAGQCADFHAHRIAFISNLARATDDFGLVFKLARHSDPKLTAKIYDRVRPQERAAAIAKMPAPPKMFS